MNIDIITNKLKEYLLSDKSTINDIELFLNYSISSDALERLEIYIDEVVVQMPDEIIKKYYDKFCG